MWVSLLLLVPFLLLSGVLYHDIIDHLLVWGIHRSTLWNSEERHYGKRSRRRAAAGSSYQKNKEKTYHKRKSFFKEKKMLQKNLYHFQIAFVCADHKIWNKTLFLDILSAFFKKTKIFIATFFYNKRSKLISGILLSDFEIILYFHGYR